jgi:protease I
MPAKVLLLAGDFVETLEAFVPFQALSMLGFDVHAVCPGKKPGQSVATAVHDFEGFQTYTEKRGHGFAVNADFDRTDAADYAGLYIPGGRAPEYLRMDARVVRLVRQFFEARKPVAAVCHGVQLLTAAGVVQGRRMCCYPACRAELERAGGVWVDHNETYSNVVVDGHLVSGPAWPAHAEVIREFSRLLGARIEHSR